MRAQVDVEEYGKHWNFFFSLAACMLATSLPVHPAVLGTVGLIMAAAHQTALSAGKLCALLCALPRVLIVATRPWKA